MCSVCCKKPPIIFRSRARAVKRDQRFELCSEPVAPNHSVCALVEKTGGKTLGYHAPGSNPSASAPLRAGL